MNSSQKIAIAGGGIIGLATGWQLLRQGADVTIFDKGIAGNDTSRVGGGMIAPNAEASFEETELLQMNRLSLDLFKNMLDELALDSGEDPPLLNNRGTLLVAVDQDDNRVLKRLYNFRQEAGLEVIRLSGSEAREKEPLLSPRIISALWLQEDCEINNLQLISSLRKAFINRGGVLTEKEAVIRVTHSNGQITGLESENKQYAFDHVLIAAGSYSASIEGLPDDLMPSLRPVKGQIITLQQTEECSLQTMIRSPRIYILPKDDGRLLVGATSEEKGFDTTVTAGNIWYLLDEGRQTVPAIHECPKITDDAGLRPATPDHKPVIGFSNSLTGISIATGFFRHGFLLAPLTAYCLSHKILGKEQYPLPACFLPRRFMQTS